MERPFFSIIVPVRNGGSHFERCLEALAASRFRDRELIIVDDGSVDGSQELARRHGDKLLRTSGSRGPGAARNLGARHARGRYLFFLDADCALAPTALENAARILEADPSLDALFGSYDDDPPAPGLVAQYKNLLHHHVHHSGRPEAATFWAGCGTIRRTAFEAVGGFDEELFTRPSIEDIELGYRLRASGRRIRLAREVQVKHYKVWTIGSLLKSDILDRGVPWTELILARGELESDLNLRWSGRVSVAAAWILIAAMAIAPWRPISLVAAGACVFVLVFLNRDLYRFFVRRRGIGFALEAIALHWFYFAYCAIAFGLGALRHLRTRLVERFLTEGS